MSKIYTRNDKRDIIVGLLFVCFVGIVIASQGGDDSHHGSPSRPPAAHTATVSRTVAAPSPVPVTVTVTKEPTHQIAPICQKMITDTVLEQKQLAAADSAQSHIFDVLSDLQAAKVIGGAQIPLIQTKLDKFTTQYTKHWSRAREFESYVADDRYACHH